MQRFDFLAFRGPAEQAAPPPQPAEQAAPQAEVDCLAQPKRRSNAPVRRIMMHV